MSSTLQIPIPDLMSAKNLLVVFPHPDDAELMAAGTVAKLARAGTRVTYAAVTDGNLGCFDPIASREYIGQTRRREQEEAAKILGVERVVWLGFDDGEVPEPDKLRPAIVSVIREVKPDFVLTLDPWLPYEAHPDHRRTAMAVVEACLFAPFPLAYPDDLARGLSPWQVSAVAMGFSAHPNTFVGIDETWDAKIQALLCHKSQFPEEIWREYSPVIFMKSMEYGQKAGSRYAEAFKVLSPVHFHVMVDAWKI